MRKRTAPLAVAALIATTLAVGSPLAAQTETELEPRDRPERLSANLSAASGVTGPDDLVQVFIQLEAPSVAAHAARAEVGAAAQQAHGRRILAQQDEVRTRLDDLVSEELSSLAVAANGLRAMVRAGDIPAILATEGVEDVAPVTRYELHNETSVPWIGGDAVAAAGHTGEDISIAIIDTGIDYTHAALGGSGDPGDYDDNDPGEVEPGTFPTDKVVAGFDFAGPTYDASDPDLDDPSPDADPLDLHGHGTHVAATAAGIDDEGDDVGTGMAPDADVYAYKVFGDTAGSTDLVADAIERALDPNNDLSIDDAVDVINMSLGADFGHPGDPSAIAAQNAAENGVVVVASAGNSGAVPYVTGSPAVADDVISVAASIDGGVEVLGIEVEFPSEEEQMEAQPGDFGDLGDPTTAELAQAEPLDACTEITSDVAGAIALVQRGICTFTAKVRAAEAAGAVGVVVFNNSPEPPIAMGHDGSEPRPEIPAVMVSLSDGERLQGALGGGPVEVTLSDAITIPKPGLTDNLAGFTSRGPGSGNTFKPDLSAPGFGIASAGAGSGDGASLSSGTSMAAPHVAGAAAQLLDWNGDLTPEQVKALLMNSATPALTEGESELIPGAVPIASQGTGVVHVDRIVDDMEGYASPAGNVFHFNPTESATQTRTIEIDRLEGDGTYDVEIVENQTLEGVTWDVSDQQVSTDGGSASLDVTVSVNPAQLDSDDGFFSQAESDGWLVLTNTENEGDRLRLGLVAVADPASTVTAAGGEDRVDVANDGPGDGFADGFTYVGSGEGALAGLGFRTGSASGEDGQTYRTVDFGLALSEVWNSPSALEVNLLFDVDEDGEDDYALVAADLGLLQGVDPIGQVATAIVDLSTEGPPLPIYFAVGDLNDRVMVLPADLTGDLGFLEGTDDGFDMDVVVFDRAEVAGVAEDVRVDLSTELTADDGLSLTVPAGSSAQVATDGAGQMLWLFQNNLAADQHAVVDVATAGPPEEPPGEELPPDFSDVPDGHLFHDEIVWLAQQDITRGCNPPANDLFCPEETVTRGQMAAFLNRALGLAPGAEDSFVDDDDSVFEGDIDRLAAADITRGCNPPANDEYCPTLELTRAQMAAFMIRGFGFTEGNGTDLFVDDDENIHEYAIDILGTADVTRGCNPPVNDRYCPDDDMTRGQMAAFIYRAYHAAGMDD